jgi:translation initiation factor IF-1
MVKNTHGGSKHKSQARKNTFQNNNAPVEPSGPNEIYAHVTKMYGNGMCQVETHCDKKMTLTCHIRGKFRGKNKKHNTVSLNSIVIIGLRDWETEYKNCDLIAIIDNTHTYTNTHTDTHNDDSFHFDNSSLTDTHTHTHTTLLQQHTLQHHIDIDIDTI